MEPLFYIYSIQHAAWWKPCACGYTRALHEAGLYTYKEAAQIVSEAVAGDHGSHLISEAMVPADTLGLRKENQ